MIRTLYNGIDFRIKGLLGRMNRFFYKEPRILSSVKSLDTLIDGKKSIARFGDGEFKLMRGGNLGFQKYDEKLAKRLFEVLKFQNPQLEIGLPKVFGSLKEYKEDSARFWRAYLGENRRWIMKQIDQSKIYLNTNMTRFWSGYKVDLNLCEEIIKKYKKIWDGRDIIFIEGKFTRMGVGNDLFDNAKSIRRILCPAENSWGSYPEILSNVKKVVAENRDALYILALGPTATVLAYDLCVGVQALDLGHLDVQYEYYILRAEKKIALAGKYVNEVEEGRNITDSIIDSEYKNSIILEIE